MRELDFCSSGNGTILCYFFKNLARYNYLTMADQNNIQAHLSEYSQSTSLRRSTALMLYAGFRMEEDLSKILQASVKR